MTTVLGNKQLHHINHFEWNQLDLPIGDTWNTLQMDIGNYYNHRLLLSIQIKSSLLISVLDTVDDTLHEFAIRVGVCDEESTLNCSDIPWLMNVKAMGNKLMCSQKLRVGRTGVVDIIENIKEFINLFTSAHT